MLKMIDLSPGVVVALMLGLLLAVLLLGYPLGYTCAGVALAVGFVVWGPRVFTILYSQGFSILKSYSMVAIPLFVYMGVMVDKSGVGKRLFEALEMLLHRLRGHLAIVVVITGTLIAASVGIIAASVVMLTLVGLPHMLSRGYNKSLATGCICAAGSLGILIPPSVLLVIYGPLAGLSVGKLFMGAFGPGLLLSALYIMYIATACQINPNLAPAGIIEGEVKVRLMKKIWMLVSSIFPIIIIILSVLGSIFLGVASPTEASAVGALATTFLAFAYKGLNWSTLKKAVIETGRDTGMIAIVGIGALAFTGVFLALGGGDVVANLLKSAPGGHWGVFAFIMLTLFLLGFFIADIGIVFIMVPLITPIAKVFGFDPIWFAIMVNVNIQTSYMTPPFAIAIYFLQGATSKEYGITTNEIIRGVTPFVVLILVGLVLCVAFPEIILWLPSKTIH